MARITIKLLEDVEQDLEGYNYSPEEFRQVGEKLKKRFERIAKALETLEKLNWQWTTSYKTILLWKKIPIEQAKKEIQGLDLQQDIFSFEDF